MQIFPLQISSINTKYLFICTPNLKDDVIEELYATWGADAIIIEFTSLECHDNDIVVKHNDSTFVIHCYITDDPQSSLEGKDSMWLHQNIPMLSYEFKTRVLPLIREVTPNAYA